MGYWTWHYSLTFDVEGTPVEILPTFVIGVYTQSLKQSLLDTTCSCLLLQGKYWSIKWKFN
jgi:hypothetical protein